MYFHTSFNKLSTSLFLPLIRIRSIKADSINKKILDIGGGFGIEFFALMYNIHPSLNLYILNKRTTKISLSNRTGFIAGLGPGGLTYTYPSIKFSQNISDVWLSVNFGREYGKIQSAYSNEHYQVDYRVDLGITVYNSPRTCTEFYMPIRIRGLHSWYTIGVGMCTYFRL